MTAKRCSGKKLALFDIDGTLVHCGGRTRKPLAEALEQIFGTCGSLMDDPFAGRTDDQIVFDALRSTGLGEATIRRALPEAKQRYLEGLERQLDGWESTPLPGVMETLERLSRAPGVALGLLTGNWQVGARWKLERAALDEYFSFGAFGDGCRDRAALPPVALAAAAAQLGDSFGPSDALIIGDTPNDVRCGRAHGLRVVAVTTGFSTRAELTAAGADWVVDDLAAAGFLLPMLEAAASRDGTRATP